MLLAPAQNADTRSFIMSIHTTSEANTRKGTVKLATFIPELDVL